MDFLVCQPPNGIFHGTHKTGVEGIIIGGGTLGTPEPYEARQEAKKCLPVPFHRHPSSPPARFGYIGTIHHNRNIGIHPYLDHQSVDGGTEGAPSLRENHTHSWQQYCQDSQNDNEQIYNRFIHHLTNSEICDPDVRKFTP